MSQHHGPEKNKNLFKQSSLAEHKGSIEFVIHVLQNSYLRYMLIDSYSRLFLKL